MPTATSPTIFEQALALPRPERERLAEALLDSLVPTDTEANRALLEECRRRWAAYKAGEVQAIPWEEALAQIDRDLENP